MSKKLINFGFGVSVEIIESDSAKIHNLKNEGQDIRNLGGRLR